MAPRRAGPKNGSNCSIFDPGWKKIVGNYWDHTMEMNDIVGNDRGIEDDPSISNLPKCPHPPCALNDDPIRFYFGDADTWPEGTTRNELYLTYYCMKRRLTHHGKVSRPFAILMVSCDHFAAGLYENGILSDSYEVEKFTKPAQGGPLMELVKAQIKKWPLEDADVFVRCSQAQKGQLTGLLPETATHIPFKTSRPSLKEVKRIFAKLTTVKKFPNLEGAKEEYHLYKQNLVLLGRDSKTSSIPSPPLDSEKEAFNLTFPEIPSHLGRMLHEALLVEDLNALISILEGNISKEKVVGFLNTCQPRLNGDNALHYASRRNMTIAVKKMLELGCDPTIRNETGETARDCCIDKEMCESFGNCKSYIIERRVGQANHRTHTNF